MDLKHTVGFSSANRFQRGGSVPPPPVLGALSLGDLSPGEPEVNEADLENFLEAALAH